MSDQFARRSLLSAHHPIIAALLHIHMAKPDKTKAHVTAKAPEPKSKPPMPPAAKPPEEPKPSTQLPAGAQPVVDDKTTTHKALAASDHPKAPEHPLPPIDSETK